LCIFATFLVFAVAPKLADTETSGTRSTGSCKQPGEALLQVARHTSSQAMPASIFEVGSKQHVAKSDNQPAHEKPMTGSNATLNEAGYKAVQKLCCGPEMATFITRLITESSDEGMGKKVCAKGGPAGLALWHDCEDDKGAEWKGLKAVLSDAQSGYCPFISDTGSCTRSPKCAKYPDAKFPKCEPVDPHATAKTLSGDTTAPTAAPDDSYAYISTFHATGCPNPQPSRGQITWWQKQEQWITLRDMYRICKANEEGRANQGQKTECCGAVGCEHIGCVKHSAFQINDDGYDGDDDNHDDDGNSTYNDDDQGQGDMQ